MLVLVLVFVFVFESVFEFEFVLGPRGRPAGLGCAGEPFASSAHREPLTASRPPHTDTNSNTDSHTNTRTRARSRRRGSALLRAMSAERLTVALIRDVFPGPAGVPRLGEALSEARARGAELAVLPELPLNGWCGAIREAREGDAEAAGGPRHQALAAAARAAGIGLIGGAIVRDDSGQRFNTALIFNREGRPVSSYRKVHLPEEEGFWETSHYEPGSAPPEVVSAFGLPIGVEICSDVNRPEMAHLLAAAGAAAIIAPRATEAGTFDRWRLVLRATALTAACWVLSVPRPEPEDGVPLGGPSIAISPDGEVLVESTERLVIVTLNQAAVVAARGRYPGYLAVRSDLYARAWQQVPSTVRPHERRG